MVAQPAPDQGPDEFSFDPEPQSQHLLGVAESVTLEANRLWAEMWGELKPYVTPGGVILSDLQKGFVPACGWSEFLERFWLLKSHLDSVVRICRKKH